MATIIDTHDPQLTETLRSIVGSAHVLVDPETIQRHTRDQSWLSPVLHRYFSERQNSNLPPVQAVVKPGTVHELKQVLAHVIRHRVPITVRGGGTSNFGQSVALEGGVILD